jgi:hypothetical protein
VVIQRNILPLPWERAGERVIGYVLLAVAALLVAACSFTRLAYMNAALAYENATPVLAWMAGDYVDMSGGQKDWVRERLQRAMAWHRAQELPEYRRFLEDMLARADGTITADDARFVHHSVRAYYHRALDHIAPDIADFVLQLDEEQVARLERRFEKDNRKFVTESLKDTPEERRRRAARKYLEHIEEWVGDLSESQRELVFSRVAELGEFPEDQLADRRYRQAEIVALARARPPREKAIEELRRLLVRTESWRRAEYREKVRLRDERLFEMFGELGATLTPEQRAALRARVRGFMHEVAELSAANPAPEKRPGFSSATGS